MLDSAMKELVDKGYTDANDANALGSRSTDGKREAAFKQVSTDSIPSTVNFGLTMCRFILYTSVS